MRIPGGWTACLAASLLLGQQAMAEPIIEENWQTYPVEGTTAGEILRQMQERGPNGFWAYTSWYVRWSADCEVRLQIDYTMPRHTAPHTLDEPLRNDWEAMLKALGQHEEKHGAHGVGAARELFETSCRDGDDIIARWAEQDRILDRETQHGRTEGVVFPAQSEPGTLDEPGGGPGEGGAAVANCASGGGDDEEHFSLCEPEHSLSSGELRTGLEQQKASGGR